MKLVIVADIHGNLDALRALPAASGFLRFNVAQSGDERIFKMLGRAIRRREDTQNS